MKKAYIIFLTALSVCILAWFLPWLYSLALPDADNDPFLAFSPVSDTFVISENGDNPKIYLQNNENTSFSKEERDSLLPQIYFTQLSARMQLPDTIEGKAMTIPNLKHSQWVFTSLPMDVNKVQPDWYFIMESMPKRVDLEDPTEVFSLDDGKVTFIDMASNNINDKRSQRFTRTFNDKGFEYPAKFYSSNITSRKAYDEGYLLVDNSGDVFHMKMRAGTPYLSKIAMPDSAKALQAFIMENNDRRVLGLVFDDRHNVYALEREGYKLVKLPVGEIDPASDRISVMANLFNIIFRTRNAEEVKWTALDTDTYDLLGTYAKTYTPSAAQRAAQWIFPFSISFSSVDDSYAYPRIGDISYKALALNIILAIATYALLRRRKRSTSTSAICAVCTVIFGIYLFIPTIILDK